MLSEAYIVDTSKRKALSLSLKQLCDLSDLEDLLSKKEAA